MKPKNGSQCPSRSNFMQNMYILLLFLLLKLFLLVQCSNNNSLTKSLEVILHEHAFKSLVHQHTGSLYNASVPSSLAGMKLSLVRLRSRTLWEKGANFSGFSIPPRTIPVPYVKRIHIVYNDLGNLSSHYFNISGYDLLTSVIGFIVYDAPSHISTITSLRKLDLRPTRQPISIEFKNLTEMIKGRTTKCAMFDENGKVSLSEMKFPNLCYTRNHGHFTIVLPSETRKKRRIWVFLVIGFVIGLFGVVLVVVVGRMVLGIFKSKKTCEMEREAEEGEFLESVVVGRSKMPVAMVTRTHPVLEGPRFP
ncbi:putative endoglucanase-like [Capsicum annuum]|uniref:Legume lectin domain-containing protein n=1 Tax=Capsicum annuum TaxID=4072 RepID=A0A2G3ADJ3_CAPAN|nr:uncharacterized protein LOC107841920 [Capsicum annuum]KAF3638737.1 putative endoglucanase-like [Capsicum annuum]PHT92322.1 hypothetical protein T459_00204 [Capsicum annuum]